MAEKNEALKEAIKSVGGKSKFLAERLGVTPQAISLWKRVPTERVLEVERISGVSRHKLRPDVFGPEQAENAA